MIKEGRIYLSIRPVVEAFEGNVEWDNENQMVKINRAENDAFLIDDVEINNDGELVITTDSGDLLNLGRVTGKDGDDGRNGKSGSDGIYIKSVRLDAGKNLIVNLSDGQTINAGNVSGASEYNTFASYDEGTKFYNLYPLGEFDCYVMKGRDKYAVTITDAYYELISINDPRDNSSWDYVAHVDGWYEFRPFDVGVVIEGYTDPILAGDEISFYYDGIVKQTATVRNDGTIRVVGTDSWVHPQIKYFHRATLYSQSIIPLSDMQDDLNDDYTQLEGVTIGGITLIGDEDEIEVVISIDTTNTSQYDAWNDLRESDIEDFLEDMVDDILLEYPNADIEGSIIDSYDDSVAVSFDTSSRGIVDIDWPDYTPEDIEDLQYELRVSFDEIEGIPVEELLLTGNEYEVGIEIYIDLTEASDYENWVDDVRDVEVEDFLEDMADEIIAYYPDADITGEIIDKYDYATIVDFMADDSGIVNLIRDL